MIDLLRALVEIESPSGSPGTAAVSQLIGAELEQLGADVSLLDGGHLRAELPGTGRPLLLSGHVDTVWPTGTLAWTAAIGRASTSSRTISYAMRGR